MTKKQKTDGNSARIEPTSNGPLKATGDMALTNSRRDFIEKREPAFLCRCGASRNKPFCDGSHVSVGFSDERSPNRLPDRRDSYRGLRITIFDNRAICSHWYAGFKDDEAKTIAAAARRATKAEDKAWHKIASTEDIAEGEVRKVEVASSILAVSKVQGRAGALDHRCPHQGGLDQGSIEDGALRCPWHGYKFDPVTGRGVGRAEKARAYPVETREDGIYAEVEPRSRSGWTVSHVMVDTMANWGVTHVFGMVGHSNLGLAEAIRTMEQSGRLTYIGVRHEGAAAFACSGFAKLSGRPAACLSIAGPGATNLLTGLWDAHMDRAPVLALTGQVKAQVLGPGAFQEIDLASAFESVAGFSQTVLQGSNHAELMSLALKSAMVNRNVAHLIFPDEVQVLDAGDQGPGGPDGRIDSIRIAPPTESLDSAMYRLWRAKRPVVIVGFGAKDGIDEVIRLAEALKAPILTTFKGKGLVADDHPLAAGVLGRSGTPIASGFMDEADLLVVFGASFSDHTGIDRDRPIIQVDFDRMALGKFHPVDSPVWGDIGVTASMMHERLGDWADPEDRRDLLAQRWRDWRAEKERRAQRTRNKGVNSALLFEVLTRTTPPDAVIAVDVGNNTYSFGRYFECKRQTVLMSGYLGSIGFAFPAAMGAWAAAPDRPILSVSGDGGFGQYMGEFTTAVKYGMNITHVLVNNAELGKISKEQRNGGWPVWQTALHNPNFGDYANLCGGRGWRVTRDEELEPALNDALRFSGPSLVEIIADPLLV